MLHIAYYLQIKGNEKTPLHRKKTIALFCHKAQMVQILITCDKAQNLQLTDTSYLLLTVERYPIYIKQSVVSSIFKCSSTGKQQKNFQTSAALHENNKTIFRQVQLHRRPKKVFSDNSSNKVHSAKDMISTICTSISRFMIMSFVNSVFSQPHSQRTFNSILHSGVSFEVMATTQPQIHHRSSPLSSFDPEKE